MSQNVSLLAINPPTLEAQAQKVKQLFKVAVDAHLCFLVVNLNRIFSDIFNQLRGLFSSRQVI